MTRKLNPVVLVGAVLALLGVITLAVIALHDDKPTAAPATTSSPSPTAPATVGVAVAGGVVLPAGKEGLGVELGFAPGALRYVVPGNLITVWATPKGAASRVLLQSIQVIATTPGAGTGEATAVVAGPGNLDFLLAVTREEAARIIDAQASGAALYFTLARTGNKG